MRFRAAFAVLALAVVPLFGQELGLQQYLQLLKTAPGVTIGDKVRFLADSGVTLSDQGLHDLRQAASSPFSPPQNYSAPSPTPKDDPYDRSDNSVWAAPKPHSSHPPHSNGSSSTTTHLGGYTLYSDSNGVTGTSNRMGPFTFYNFSDGLSGTSTQLGDFTIHNLNNGLSGTSNRLGSFTFHNFNDGVSGTSNRMGNFTFHNFSDGTSCTSNQLGAFTFTNCNK